MKKIISALGLAAVIFALAVPTAFAAEFIVGDEDTGNVTLSAGETHRNVYTAGGTIFVNSNVQGDLFAVGGTLTIESNIEQDLVIAGGTVTINGEIGGDIRVAGGTVTINNRVSGDVLAAGGTIIFTERASVGGDAIVGSGNVTVDAPVGGNVKVGGGTVVLNSVINGSVKVMADQALTIGSKAVISQPISYEGRKEAVVQDGAQVGEINFEQLKGKSENKAGAAVATIFTIAFVIKSLALIIAGLLLMYMFPRTSKESIDYMQRGMWMNLLIGFVALIVAPIAFFILLITLFGMYIAFLVILIWLVMLLLAALVASVFAGAWIIKLLTKKTEMTYDWQALVIGIIVLGIVMIIPVIGALIFFILLLMAFGGLLRQLNDRIKSEHLTNQPTNI